MLILVRALTYATLFIGIVLVYVPARVLTWSGIARPATIGVQQVAGTVITTAGAAIALWCVFTFALLGRGTPAPFDPPRRLVIRGPYRFVRNPMYIGAGLALSGAALFYGSLQILGYVALLFVATHLFVVRYEEPTLARTFGAEYETYRRRVRRWWPVFFSLLGVLLIALLAVCSRGADEVRLEEWQNGAWQQRPVSAYEVSGRRDGATTRVRAVFTLSGGERVAIDLEVNYDPTPILASGRWHLEGAQPVAGSVEPVSLRFLGGQGEGPSLGGTFLLRANDESDAKPRYRAVLPLRPVEKPDWNSDRRGL